MKIGVVSDTHNNLKNIETIINLFNGEKVTLVVHTGDITNARSLEQFSKLNSKLIGVFGNNDRNEKNLKAVAEENNFMFQEPPFCLTLEKRKIAIFHEPDFIENFLLDHPTTDIVFHGHTHRFREEQLNGTMIFNPGESAGILKGKNAIGIMNLESLEIKRIFF